MEVSGQLNAPAALRLGKELLLPIGYDSGWTPEPVWARWCGEKFPAPIGTRTLPIIQPVAQRYTTELPRLEYEVVDTISLPIGLGPLSEEWPTDLYMTWPTVLAPMAQCSVSNRSVETPHLTDSEVRTRYVLNKKRNWNSSTATIFINPPPRPDRPLGPPSLLNNAYRELLPRG
jgi:hypothetical protein